MLRSSALAAACMLAIPGCLPGGYDTAYNASLDRYREAGDLQRLHPEPKRLAGDRLLVRVPKLFTKEGQDKPPFLDDLPGFGVTMEEVLPAGGTGEKMPASLSIWAPVEDASGIEDVKKRILAKIQAQKDPAFANASWNTVDVPRGEPSSWAVMNLQGQQPFDRFGAGEKGVRETKSTPGTTKIWVAADQASKVCTVLMWRVPEELAAAVPVEELGTLVARTVQMKPAEQPPAAAPDAAAAPPAAGAPAK